MILTQHPFFTPPRVLRGAIATATFSGALALGVMGGVAVPAHAAPVSNLTFNINATVSAAGASSGIGAAGQKLSARVLLRGNSTRLETTYAGQKSVTLVTPPYIYRLLPSSKAGVRWKMDGSRQQTMGGMGLNPQELIRNPGKIRALLLQNGAKRVGSSTLGGVAVDIYTINKPKEQISNAKAYLRKSDSLPLKFEAQAKGLKVSALWSNYARPKDLSASLFQAPTGYRIREAKSAPPMSMF